MTLKVTPRDPARFIEANFRFGPVPAVPEISLFTAHPGSGVRKLLETSDTDAPPYWAYVWGGGTVLARYILDNPQVVRGRSVVDLGAGGGIVGIAAAKAGARSVLAAEIDPLGRVALALNAKANTAAMEITGDDLLAGPAPEVEVFLVGDLFYAAELAARVLPFLRACRAAGNTVLIGDPGRNTLPRPELIILAEYDVPDFGDGRGGAARSSAVYTLAG